MANPAAVFALGPISAPGSESAVVGSRTGQRGTRRIHGDALGRRLPAHARTGDGEHVAARRYPVVAVRDGDSSGSASVTTVNSSPGRIQ